MSIIKSPKRHIVNKIGNLMIKNFNIDFNENLCSY